MPQLVTVALLAGEMRPRANTISDGVLLTLLGVNLNPGADPEDSFPFACGPKRTESSVLNVGSFYR